MIFLFQKDVCFHLIKSLFYISQWSFVVSLCKSCTFITGIIPGCIMVFCCCCCQFLFCYVSSFPKVCFISTWSFRCSVKNKGVLCSNWSYDLYLKIIMRYYWKLEESDGKEAWLTLFITLPTTSQTYLIMEYFKRENEILGVRERAGGIGGS